MGEQVGSDVVVGEDGGLGVELVDMGGLNDGVSVAGEVAVALVVCDHNNDVWSLCGKS